MAIFHCAVSHGSRKDGQSGAAKVAYIMRTGKYGRDPGELLGACAGHLPSWAGGNPRVFFAAADEYERSNGRLFTQVLFAIPNELSDQDALLMAYHYAEAATETGAPYALAVHRGGVEVPEVENAAAAPEEADEEDLPPHNRHGHLVICERIDDGIERTARAWFRRANKTEPALGGAAKDREMNGRNWVPEIRFACAEYVNYALERAGFSERVTCESHETRIARAEAVGDEETAERLRLAPPGIHLGPTAWAIEKGRKGRKGRTSWRGDLNRAIAAEGEELRGKVEELNAKLSQLDVQEEAVTEKLEAARRIAAAQFEQREESLLGTSLGGEILRAVRVEMVGDSAAPPSVVQLGEMLEVAEDRFGAALDLREAGFQETSVGSRYLVDATQSILGGEQSPTLPQRELIITTAESRLEQDLDRREATLRASVAGAEVLDTMQLEGADEYGSVLTLVQRAQLVETAGRRLERREAEEEVRRELDRREEVLRSVSLGAQYLSEAEQEGLGEGKRAAVLAARDALVTKAEQRLEADLSRRESDLVATSFGPALLREAFGERGDGDAGLSFAARDRGLEQVETRVGEALRVQEEALRSIPFGRQCLPEETQGRSGDAEGVTAPLAERESRVRVAEQRVGEELARLEKEHVAKAGHDLLVEAAGALGDGRTFSLGERWEVYERAQSRFEEEQRKLDREEAAVGEDPAGAEFLRNARHEVIGAADREVTLAERARIVKAAAALQAAAEAKREAAAKQRAEQERETRRWEEQRDAGEQALARQPGGEDLYHAHLADLDPKWDRQRSNSSSRQNIDAALAAAASDGTRRERLRVVLSDKVDAARYREELGKVAGQFKTPDLDRALAVAEQEREKRETRRWEEQRDAGFQALSRQPGGEDLYHAHLADLDPKWDRQRSNSSSRQNIDAALAAAASDGTRRERLRVVLSDKVDAARYREELGKVAGQFKTSDLDRALAAAEREREKREPRRWEGQRAAGFQALDRQPGGVDLYHAHLADLDPKWDRKRNDSSSRQNIDAALAAAASDGTRLERLRVVLSNEVDAARYREELEKVAGQFKTSDLDRALAVVEQEREERATRQWEEQKAARVRREARHQMVSDTPGGDERLRAAGWEKARTDGMQDRVLATVERSLTADFNRREQQLRTDDEGKAFLRRGRLEVLEADREPETLAEHGKVIERGEVLRQAERKRRATEQRVARLKRLFAVSGGDKVFFASLDARKPRWREQGTVPADVDVALDMAEQRIDRTKPATAEHEVVVNAEQTFSDAPSAAWRQAGDRFPKGSAHARVSQQLADRALAGALAAEREEPPASPALVQRLFTWLYAQVDKLPAARSGQALGSLGG